jgi:hypothetical protein
VAEILKAVSPLLCLQLQTGCSDRRPIGRPVLQKVGRYSLKFAHCQNGPSRGSWSMSRRRNHIQWLVVSSLRSCGTRSLPEVRWERLSDGFPFLAPFGGAPRISRSGFAERLLSANTNVGIDAHVNDVPSGPTFTERSRCRNQVLQTQGIHSESRMPPIRTVRT